MFYSEFKF